MWRSVTGLIEALYSSEKTGNTYRAAKCHVPEDFCPQRKKLIFYSLIFRCLHENCTMNVYKVNRREQKNKINSLIHLVVCLTTGPKPLPKRALHIVRSKASSFKWEYLLLSLRSSNSFLRLLPCLPVTSIPPCIFPSVTRCRRQFRYKMWPIQFASVYVFHVYTYTHTYIYTHI